MPRPDSTFSKLPGLKEACRKRGWTIRDGATAAGVRWSTFRDAHEGKAVDRATARAIAAALEQNPPTAGMRELLEVTG